MSALQAALADYLTLRRGLGYQLDHDARELRSFVDFCDHHETEFVTVAVAVAWVTMPVGTRPSWWANRMTILRGFATFLHGLDPRHDVPPADLFRHGPHRAVPYLYTDTEIAALTQAAAALPTPMTALTMTTVIGLLAATGLRISEALAADVADLDPQTATLTVRRSKYGRSRLVPLHPHTTTALAAYLRRRDQLCPHPVSEALFLSTAGTRKRYAHVNQMFRRVRNQTGLTSRSTNCRPRLHDFRHSFAVRTLIDWYRDGGDVAARLPLLSAYLGHREPKYTYWYLHAAPELLAEAAHRLEPTGLGEGMRS
jgi:integrase/recombinase XerD